MGIQLHRREKLTSLLSGPMFKGDRGLFCETASIFKGRLSQLLDEQEPFGDVAASNLATSIGLGFGYFNAFEFDAVEGSGEDDVVVPAQSEVKAYLNQRGDIILSRPRDDCDRSFKEEGV